VLSPSDFLYNDAPWQASRPANIVGIGANYELVDIADVFQPFLRYNRATFPSVPLWNPYISGGRPYLAKGQSAVNEQVGSATRQAVAAVKLLVGDVVARHVELRRQQGLRRLEH